MKNQELSQIIDNLKGRTGYEEKKAKKLGYTSLYDYFEDKVEKKQIAIQNEKELVKQAAIQRDILKENKLSQKKCKCC
jgi:hypothetical protein